MKRLKVLSVVGTRPEIIRLSCVLQKLDASPAIEHVLVHTGQNYDYELNEIFFQDLGLRKPDYFLNAAGNNATTTARAAFDLFMEYPGGMGVFWNGYSVKDQASVDFAAARWARLHSTEARQPNDGRFLVVRDLGEWMSRHAHEVEKQCLFFAEQDQVPQALARFRAMPGVEVVQGSPENIEVTAAGVDKGEALLTLADRLGIPRAQTLAVGDSENDRAMLEKAGVAAVMANGMPQIKALADLVTTADCDHDGVAEVFETLGL